MRAPQSTSIAMMTLVALCAMLGQALGFAVDHHRIGHLYPVTGAIRTDCCTMLGMTESSSEVNDDEDDWETAEEASTNAKVLRFLEKKYPVFSKLLVQPNDSFIKELQANPSNTLFVVPDSAMESLGTKKLSQLEDPRNQEIMTKMGGYHLIIGETLSATEIQTEDWTKGRPKDGSKPNTLFAAIVTQSGEVPVGRNKSGGGFLGIGGGKEDGDIVIGPEAKVVQSFKVENCLVHEMDSLISPVQLWRYADQLRIPGF